MLYTLELITKKLLQWAFIAGLLWLVYWLGSMFHVSGSCKMDVGFNQDLIAPITMDAIKMPVKGR